MENTNGSVKMVPGACPKCGGQLELDPSQEAAVCPYCGTPYIVEKAINKYTVEHAHIDHVDNVNIDGKGVADSVIGFFERQMDRNREENKEDRAAMRENSREFMRNSWKIFAVMFAAMIILFVLGNLLGFFN